jgi:hypothetical protein
VTTKVQIEFGTWSETHPSREINCADDTNPAEAVDEIDSRAAVAARRKKNRRCNFMVGSKK